MNIPNKVVIKKLHDGAIFPRKGTRLAAGLDISSCVNAEPVTIHPLETVLIHTGLTLEIPEGFEVQVRSRSGLAAKNQIFVLNSPGTIDADYKGEVLVVLTNLSKQDFVVEPAMRIAQMVISRVYTDELYDADVIQAVSRGTGGCGSTGL